MLALILVIYSFSEFISKTQDSLNCKTKWRNCCPQITVSNLYSFYSLILKMSSLLSFFAKKENKGPFNPLVTGEYNL